MNSPFLICLIGFAIVLFLFWLIRFILAPKRSFSDFFVGDTGGYSLSRLQAVLWAVVIIAEQVSAFIAAISKHQAENFSLVFSQEVMWLLGLSLASYVVVKGITVSQVNSGQLAPKPINKRRNWSDLVMSDEGLDFSRFQMLIWTIFSVLVFISSYYHYIDRILQDTTGNISSFFPRFDDVKKNLPTIDMSLIVLMGLSQGAYIGRKLVPQNRVEEFSKEYVDDVETREYGLSFQESELKLMLLNPEIPVEKKAEIQLKLNAILEKKAGLEDEKAAIAKSLVTS
jgi:hypothetical protein